MNKIVLNEFVVAKHTLVESDSSKLPARVLCRVEYPICNIGKLNKNNRIYEKKVWEDVIANQELQEKMENRCLFGQAEHPESTESNLEKTSHVIISMRIDENSNKVYQTIDVLDTYYGRLVDTILEAQCSVGVSTRAEGELEEAVDEDGNKYHRVVAEAYDYITTDFTAEPSTINPYPNKVERTLVTQIDTGVEEGKINKEYATFLLEKLSCKEAKVLLESFQSDDSTSKEKKLEEDKTDKKVKEVQNSINTKIEDDADKIDISKEVENDIIEGKKKELTFECFDGMVEFLKKKWSTGTDDEKKKLKEAIDKQSDFTEEESQVVDGPETVKKDEDDDDDIDEKISLANKQYRDLQIEEASTRAERDKAIEVAEQANENVIALSNMHDMEVEVLSAKLDDEIDDTKRIFLEKALEKRVVERNKAVAESALVVKEHKQKFIILKKTYEKELNKVKKDYNRKLIVNYANACIEARSLKLTARSRALLEECSSCREVDLMLESLIEDLRESALHLTLNNVIVNEQIGSPEALKLKRDIGMVFDGMFGKKN